ncbi:MAG: TIGR00730 family Rossman fold protein, partial [Phycisphaerae bacterium]
TMHERKAIMSDRCDAYVILPGGFGTYDELIEVVTWKQLRLHDKPIVVINVGGFFDPLLSQADHAIREGFIRPEYRALIDVVANADEAVAFLNTAPEPTISRTART